MDLASPRTASDSSAVVCATCGLAGLCAVVGPGHDPRSGADGARIRRLKAGATLFSPGEPQSSLFAVRAGFVKTSAPREEGAPQVVGVHIMGDVLGLDALGGRRHQVEARGIGRCQVCELPLGPPDRPIDASPEAAAELRRLMSAEIERLGERIAVLGGQSARQRVAGYLLEMSRRWSRQGYSGREFSLCMTRGEIGSYLALTLETVSRTLSYFASRGWIEVRGRRVVLRDAAALAAQVHAA